MLRKIHRTKKVSFEQMTNMAWNLRKKFNQACSVEITSWAFTNDKGGCEETDFRIWISERKIHISKIGSWEALQTLYFNLMKEEV